MAAPGKVTLANLATWGAKNANPVDLTLAQETIVIDQFTQQIPVSFVNGTENRYRREVTRVPVVPHHVGGTVCEGVGSFTPVTDQVGRLLAQIPLDKKIQAASNNVSQIRDQLQSTAWELAEKLGYYMINGNGGTTSSDGEIKGLKILSDALPATQWYLPATSAAGVALQLIHLDKIRKLVKYPIDFYLMHSDLYIDYKDLAMAMGGNALGEVQRPFASFAGGSVVIQDRGVPAYDGIPIYTSDHIQTESCYGNPLKHRIYAGSFQQSKGLEMFFDPSNTTMGIQVDPVHTKEGSDEDFWRVRDMKGLSLRSTLSLSYGSNFKITNS